MQALRNAEKSILCLVSEVFHALKSFLPGRIYCNAFFEAVAADAQSSIKLLQDELTRITHVLRAGAATREEIRP